MRAGNHPDLTGKKFGMLTARSPIGTRACGAFYRCRCDCGKRCIASESTLQQADTRDLNCGCSVRKKRKNNSALAPGESMRRRLIHNYKTNARTRHVSFELSDERMVELLTGNCYYCGGPPNAVAWHKSHYGTFLYNGVDRLNNSLGYIEGNVASCCRDCNFRKGSSDIDEFLDWVVRVAERHGLVRGKQLKAIRSALRRGVPVNIWPAQYQGRLQWGSR